MNKLIPRKIVITEDGSHSIYVPDLEEHFHSIHGAIRESCHVFIQNGLFKCNKRELIVLEAGFGTGLNALLTLIHRENRDIRYFSLEKYPLSETEYMPLNYTDLLPGNRKETFLRLHQAKWDQEEEIAPGFKLTKFLTDITTFRFGDLPCFDLIYFDAFAPGKQPELWEESVLKRIAENTAAGGVFVTYCAQGELRRKLTRLGFKMQRIPGPPGKKEMLSGEKTESCPFSLKN
jgi:tRNA U34 5-methylaminomethyl-2-thiouridine-forming methyltransferase MnmC